MKENQKSGLPEQEPEPQQMVNLCVKVPISQRRYWMSKAKEQGITVTERDCGSANPEIWLTRKPEKQINSSIRVIE